MTKTVTFGTLHGHLTGGCLGHSSIVQFENALGSRFEALGRRWHISFVFGT
jgi:hypothetical protein